MPFARLFKLTGCGRSLRVILEATGAEFGFSVDDLCGNSRLRQLVIARQVGMYVFRELTDFSYPAIAKEFGGRDHTTVIHAVSKIEGLMKERRQLFDRVMGLMQRIKTGEQPVERAVYATGTA